MKFWIELLIIRKSVRPILLSVLKHSFFILCVATLTMCLQVTDLYAFSLFRNDESSQDDTDVPVEVIADHLEYMTKENKIVGKDNVIVTYKDMSMTCDFCEVYSETKEAFAEGHVVLNRDGKILKGDKGYYNFTTNQGSFPKGTFIEAPYFGTGEEIEQVSKDKIIIQDGVITTCDHVAGRGEIVHYKVKASKFVLHPGDKAIAYNVRFLVGDVPIFWLPIFQVPLDDNHAPFQLDPGYSKEEGYYALSSKRYSINDNIKGKVHVDYRSKRGWGFGNDLDYDYGTAAQGLVRLYYTKDERAPNVKSNDPLNNLIEDDRYRVTWRHKSQLTKRTILSAAYNNFHDPYLLKDFFEREYEEEVQPETYVNITHNADNFGLLMNFEKRINHYESYTEKLPEIRFNWNNQELIKRSRLYYKNETSVINFNQKIGHSDSDFDVVRFDTFHEISYPRKIFQVALKPYLNWRGNYYSKNVDGEENITRQAAGGGLESNIKFYRVFDIATNFLGLNINKLRHIVQPSIKYDCIRHRSVLPGQFHVFDYIDSIDDKDEVTFGINNKLQTKRLFGEKETTVELFDWSSTLTYDYKSEAQSGSAFTEWNNVFELRPYKWCRAKFEATYDVPNNEFSEADLDLEMRQEGKWHIGLQNRYLHEESKLWTLDGALKLNDLWGVGGYVRLEAFKEDVYQELEVRATRNLHCWLLDFGYNQRHSDIDKTNREIFFELTLKAFPEYPLKSGNRASYSRIRMGDTVSGANIGTSYEDTEYDYIRY